tara:strand:+ start:53 stop:253 length:201 start_codon:yes stop_codon:yes gene_type:complete
VSSDTRKVIVRSVAPEPLPFLNTAAGEPLPALLTTNDFKRVLPPFSVPVLVAVFAIIELAIVASYY